MFVHTPGWDQVASLVPDERNHVVRSMKTMLRECYATEYLSAGETWCSELKQHLPLRILVCRDHHVRLLTQRSSTAAAPSRMQEYVPRCLHEGKVSNWEDARPYLCGDQGSLVLVRDQLTQKEGSIYMAQYFPAPRWRVGDIDSDAICG